MENEVIDLSTQAEFIDLTTEPCSSSLPLVGGSVGAPGGFVGKETPMMLGLLKKYQPRVALETYYLYAFFQS